MNRRGFLKATSAIAAGAALPAGPLPVDNAEPLSALGLSFRGLVQELVKQQQAMNGYYLAFMHPSCVRDLRDIEARERWRHAYRSFRVASRERFIEYDPRAVLRDFGKSTDGLREGQLGRIGGINIIDTSLAVPNPLWLKDAGRG